MKTRTPWWTLVLLALCGPGLATCHAPEEGSLSDRGSITDNPAMAHGADIGWLSQLESKGITWVDAQGVVTDPVFLLQQFGVDAIRLRVMVNPDLDSSVGFTDQANVVEMARRCADLGLKLFLDFHFSDTWADPAKQFVPAAWVDADLDELKILLASHVTSVLEALEAEGVSPTWVQLGNEIPSGLIWGTKVSAKVAGSTGWTTLVALLNAGYDAVKAVDPKPLVLVHLDRGYDNGLYRWWFDHYQQAGGKWDAIGLSFYPYWQPQGTVAQLKANMVDLVNRYGKPVMVAEVGGRWNDPAGTKKLLLDVRAAVAQVPGDQGLGLFYWEPESSPSVVGGYALGASKPFAQNQLQFTDAMNAFRE